MDLVTTRIKTLADKQKQVMRDDIIAIANDIAGALAEEQNIIQLEEVRVSTGNKVQPTAHVTLIMRGQLKTGEGRGVGPVDAVSKAISAIIGPSISLKEYNLKAITGGTNALANVSITVEDDKGNVFSSEAVDEDVIMASAKALVKGINRALSTSIQRQAGL